MKATASSSAHKKNVQSVGGPGQLIGINPANVTVGTNSAVRHVSMTPDRENTNSNQVFASQPAP